MSLRNIDLMIAAIKRQNDYDYKIEEDKERINNNIKEYRSKLNTEKNVKKEKIKRRMEEVKKINLSKKAKKVKEILKNSKTINPLDSIEYNNKALIPIAKDKIYNYINNYNFDRNKILYQNEENRLKISKSVNYKINNYSINKKLYMDTIKNVFGEKNLECQKKTKNIFENFKKSNIDIRNKMNLVKAKKYNNFINYMQKKEYDKEIYNDILNNKRILAKEKYEDYFKKKDKLILKRIRDLKYGKIEDDYSDPYKNCNTINNIKKKTDINKLKKIVNKDVKKMKNLQDENMVKLNIEKENKIKQIIENENKHFNTSNNIINTMNAKKTKSLIDMANNNINIENRLKEAKNKYERKLKSEIIYKKGQF